MSWILIAIFAYFLNAVVFVADKFLVSKKVSSAAVYSFYVGALSIFVLAFIPFGFFIPPLKILLTALLSGVVFLFALYFFFIALLENEASRVAAIIGGLSPIFLLVLSAIFMKEFLQSRELLAFLLLLAGSLLICFGEKGLQVKVKKIGCAVFAAFLFAISFFLTKLVYSQQPFWNGFIWSRLGSFFAAFLLLIPRKNRSDVFRAKSSGKQKKAGLMLVANKALAGIHFVFLNWALSKGSAVLVNALQGIQYAFVFLITLIFSIFFPKILREDIDKVAVWKKICAILLIIAGIVVLNV
ncbi:MAG: DMT family transporter [bacterium]